MRFTLVILCAVLCLTASAQGKKKVEASDEDIVAAAEKLVAEARAEEAIKTGDKTDEKSMTVAANDAAAGTTTAETALGAAGATTAPAETGALSDAAIAAAATAKDSTTTGTTAAVTDAAKESEIPVFTKSEKVTKSENSLIMRLIASLAFIGIVGGAMVFAGRRWKRDKDKGGDKTRIEVLHQYHLGPKRTLALVRVAGEAVLIGCTDQSVNLLKSVTLIEDEFETTFSKDFNGFLEDEFTVEDMRSALGSSKDLRG
jgi:flagellar protein FliO/FliZ